MSNRGLALVTVLWVLVLLSLIAASFTATTRTEINLTRNQIEGAKAEALADAGVYRAIQGLIEPDITKQWRADARTYQLDLGDGVVWISIQDEGGKIDLNRGTDEHLRELFLLVGLDEQSSAALVDAIADFRDEDDLHRLNGAEDPDYAEAGLPYGAKDAPFEHLVELQQVLGMTPEPYRKVAPFLTVYSKRAMVNVATAPREVLLAVPGVDRAGVEALLMARSETEDSVSPEALPIPDAPQGSQQGFFTSVGIGRSPAFTIRAEAHARNGGVFVREAVVELTGYQDRPYQFLTWRQGRRASPEDSESD